MVLHTWLIPLLLVGMAPGDAGTAAESTPEKFVVLSEFQVWADAATPEVYKKLNELYLTRGRCHSFMLYPHYENFVWDAERMRHWVDEAVALERVQRVLHRRRHADRPGTALHARRPESGACRDVFPDRRVRRTKRG